MESPKVDCLECGVEILKVTADRTGGLCMPCKTGSPRRPDPNEPLEVSCGISSLLDPQPILFALAQDVSARLEVTRHFGGSKHANKFEMEAQRALLRHCLRYRVSFRLNNDHWGTTGSVFVTLFEEGKAEMEVAGVRYRYSQLKKQEWKEGDHPLAMEGGFSYLLEGREICRVMTCNS